MTPPEEYEVLECGSFRLKEYVPVDYTQPYWESGPNRSSLQDQCYNIHGYRSARGETKAFSILRHCVGKDLLEIGCSPGEFLRIAGVAGFHCVGVDPCSEQCEFVSERAGCQIINGMFPDVAHLIPGSPFDTIVAMDVIEHVQEPEKFVEAAMELLLPNGRLILMMPAIMNDGLFNEKNFCSDHINIFSEKRLKEWLKPSIFDRWIVGHEIVVCPKKYNDV